MVPIQATSRGTASDAGSDAASDAASDAVISSWHGPRAVVELANTNGGRVGWARMRILLVEDDQPLVRIITKSLTQNGFEV